MRNMMRGAAVIAMLLAGCGGGGSVAAPLPDDGGVESHGAELFQERVVGSVPGCVTCHSLDEGVTLVGPSLFGIADRAATRVPWLSADDYVRQSIVEPDAFVVPDFAAGQMAGGWAQVLSETQIDSLITYLLEE